MIVLRSGNISIKHLRTKEVSGHPIFKDFFFVAFFLRNVHKLEFFLQRNLENYMNRNGDKTERGQR